MLNKADRDNHQLYCAFLIFYLFYFCQNAISVLNTQNIFLVSILDSSNRGESLTLLQIRPEVSRWPAEIVLLFVVVPYLQVRLHAIPSFIYCSRSK